LEKAAVEKAIQNFTPEGYEELRQRNIRYLETNEQGISRKLFLQDRDFHLQIVEMARNHTLVKHFTKVYDITFLKHRIEQLNVTERRVMVRKEHEEILAAIGSRDVKAAVSAVENHIKNQKEDIMTILS